MSRSLKSVPMALALLAAALFSSSASAMRPENHIWQNYGSNGCTITIHHVTWGGDWWTTTNYGQIGTTACGWIYTISQW